MTDCRKCKYFICCDLFKQIFYMQKDEYCDEFKPNNEKKTEEETNEENS